MPVAVQVRDERPDEQVHFSCRSGWPNSVLVSLTKAVGAHSRRFHHCKIGISNDPCRRWREAYRPHGWHAMQVLYRSTSHQHVCRLESALVSRFFERDDRLTYWYYNEVGGGGGPKPVSGPYFLYLVTAPKYARLY